MSLTIRTVQTKKSNYAVDHKQVTDVIQFPSLVLKYLEKQEDAALCHLLHNSPVAKRSNYACYLTKMHTQGNRDVFRYVAFLIHSSAIHFSEYMFDEERYYAFVNETEHVKVLQAALKAGIPKQLTYVLYRAFLLACNYGHLRIIYLLDQKEYNYPGSLEEGFQIACKWGYVKLVKYFLKKGEGKFLEEKYESAIFAVKKGYSEILECILPNLPPFLGPHLFKLAMEAGHIDVLEVLLKQCKSHMNAIPKHLCTSTEKHIKTYKYFSLLAERSTNGGSVYYKQGEILDYVLQLEKSQEDAAKAKYKASWELREDLKLLFYILGYSSEHFICDEKTLRRKRIKSFFNIASSLPLELQERLCNLHFNQKSRIKGGEFAKWYEVVDVQKL